MFRFISHKFRFISPHPERNARRRTDKVGDVMKPQLGLDRSTSNQQPTGVHYVCRYFEPFFASLRVDIYFQAEPRRINMAPTVVRIFFLWQPSGVLPYHKVEPKSAVGTRRNHVYLTHALQKGVSPPLPDEVVDGERSRH